MNIQEIKEKISRSIIKGNISHFYIVECKNNNYSIDFFKWFTKMLLCEQNKNSNKDECKCKICTNIDKNNNVNVMILDVTCDKNNIGINDIREIKKVIKTKPLIDKRRFICVCNTDSMTIQASNSLLHTLENSPYNDTWVFLCNNLHNILSTIRSRAQIIKLINEQADFSLKCQDVKEYIEKKNIVTKEKLELILSELDLYSKNAINYKNFFISEMFIKQLILREGYTVFNIFIYLIEYYILGGKFDTYPSLEHIISMYKYKLYTQICESLLLARHNLSIDIILTHFSINMDNKILNSA